ncbi:MAG: PilZ domain-containing protein [Candidatus Aminicenantes bacterium]|nr:PilZ domain-containing protein [Candidatus Aminicenantes bacterium]
MPKTAVAKVKQSRPKRTKVITVPVDVNRRREWRFELPLKAIIEGILPQGKKFVETAKLENISSGGAYFCLDSGVIVGSKLHLLIDVPKKVSEGKNIRLRIGGITVRLEKPEPRKKRQGVAVRFDKNFEFITPKAR